MLNILNIKKTMLSTKRFTILFSITAISFFSFTDYHTKSLQSLQTIVIDAGHGGKDPGTAQGKEKKYALDIALKVGEKIKQKNPNIKVIYTRKTDVFIPLHERAAIANRNKADLFISIHCNANNNKGISGTESYVMGLHKSEANLELAKRENNVITLEEDYKKTYKGFDPNSALAHIMLANYQNAYMMQSMNFAAKVEKKMAAYGNRSRGVKQAGFLVIWETTMPSVLIETGYLTNTNDSAILNQETGRTKIATAIVEAFQSYKNEVEGNQ